jgi:hypothetical protein
MKLSNDEKMVVAEILSDGNARNAVHTARFVLVLAELHNKPVDEILALVREKDKDVQEVFRTL